MPHLPNVERRMRAQRALSAWRRQQGPYRYPDPADIVDLMADLLHLAHWRDSHGLSESPMEDLPRIALDHALAELAEERGA